LRSWRTTFAAGSRTFRRAMRRHAGIAISTRSAAFSRSMTARAPREPPMNDAASLALRDDAARADALDITRSWLVQAPAGSGKTSLLIQRYLALLAAVERPEHIVAMTFTRKAAAEMRARIVQALSDAGAPAGDAEIPAHEALTRRLAQAALEHERQMGWRLLEQPARLRIVTIDALASALARQAPLAAGVGALPAFVDDASPLYRAAARAALAGALATDAHWQ